MKLQERICGNLQEFGRGFMRIHKTLWRFTRIHETLGEDLQGFTSLLERIHETLGEHSGDFGTGFIRLWKRICGNL